MAKFCTKCGKKLEDGKTCSCLKNAPKKVQTENKDLITTILDVAKGMFTKPVDTMKSFINDNNFAPALIILGVASVITSIVSCLFIKEVYTTIMSAMSPFGSLGMQTDISYPRIFVSTLLGSMASYVALAGLLYLVVAKIFKGASSFKKMVTLLAVANIVMIASLLVSAIFMYVSAQLMLIVLVFGALIYCYNLYNGLKYASDLDANKMGYAFAIAETILFIVAVFILPKIMM